jgi:hypothetical protein
MSGWCLFHRLEAYFLGGLPPFAPEPSPGEIPYEEHADE